MSIRKFIGELKMELNNIKLFAQAAALNKAQEKEVVKEEKKEVEVRDNKPAEQQVEADAVLAFMAGKTVDFQAKVGKKEGQEDRIAGFMADFEEAFAAAKELGLSDEAALKVLDRM